MVTWQKHRPRKYPNAEDSLSYTRKISHVVSLIWVLSPSYVNASGALSLIKGAVCKNHNSTKMLFHHTFLKWAAPELQGNQELSCSCLCGTCFCLYYRCCRIQQAAELNPRIWVWVSQSYFSHSDVRKCSGGGFLLAVFGFRLCPVLWFCSLV